MTALEKASIMVTMEDVRTFLSMTNLSLLDSFDTDVYEKVIKMLNKDGTQK